MVLDFLWVVAGLVMILLGSDWLVGGASSIARKYGISEFVIGMTIVGIGTSTPELVSSGIAAVGGHGDMALGNVIGSNICNILLILGVTALISPIGYTRSNVRKDLLLAIGISLLLLVLLYNGFGLFGGMPGISRVDALCLLLVFAIFMIDSFRASKIGAEDEADSDDVDSMPMGKSIALVVLGLGGLILGGHFFVEHTVNIAKYFNVSEAFISITLMAVGTSLPELATCVVAAIKGKNQLALGNIIGSNIFNIALIIGASAFISPFQIDSISTVDMAMVLISVVMLWIAAFTFKRNQLDRIEGVIFLLMYIGYIVYLALNI